MTKKGTLKITKWQQGEEYFFLSFSSFTLNSSFFSLFYANKHTSYIFNVIPKKNLAKINKE